MHALIQSHYKVGAMQHYLLMYTYVGIGTFAWLIIVLE